MNNIKNIFSNLLSVDYWFAVSRGELYKFDYAILIIGAFTVFLSIVFLLTSFVRKERIYRLFWRNGFSNFFLIGLGLLLWFFLRYEFVIFLGSKFVAMILILTGAYFAYSLISQYRKILNGTIVDNQQQKLDKYLLTKKQWKKLNR